MINTAQVSYPSVDVKFFMQGAVVKCFQHRNETRNGQIFAPTNESPDFWSAAQQVK